MANIIAISNPKGGVGRTTVSINLAASLAYLGKKTLLIDSDPHGSATVGLGYDRYKSKESLYNVFVGKSKVEKNIIETKFQNLFLIPSTPKLLGAEVEIATLYENNHFRLKERLETIKEQFDYIVIDCPPGIGLNVSVLISADLVIIPTTNDLLSKAGVEEMFESLKRITTSFNRDLKIGGVLFNKPIKFKNDKKIKTIISNVANDNVYSFFIPQSNKVLEAHCLGKPLIAHSKKDKATKAFLQLAKEVISNE